MAGDNWTNRPQVVRMAEQLNENVEQFDNSLHKLEAPKRIIDLTHRSEETVSAFAEEVRVAPYSQVVMKLDAIRKNIRFLHWELGKYPSLIYNPAVRTSWEHLWICYRKLDHEIFAQIPTEDPVGPGPGATLKLNGAEYQVMGGGAVKSSESSVAGTGTILFKQALPEEDNNYALEFALEDGGSVTLIADADDSLKGGANLTFLREGKALKVKLVAGKTNDDLSGDFTTVDASVPLKISVDVHGHGHLIIWVGDGEEQEFAFNAKVAGLRWGLTLDKSTVTAAKPGEAHEEGEEGEGGHDH